MIHSLLFGGAERQFVELVKGVRKVKEIEPHICYLEEYEEGYKSQLIDLGLPLHILERRRKYDFRLFRKLHHYVSVNNIQLIHSFCPLAGLIAVSYGKLMGIPIVASTIRNSKDIGFTEYLNVRLQSLLADKFIANSHAGFMARFKKMRRNFQVIYNGIDLDRFKTSRNGCEAIRSCYNLDQFDYVITMIASLNRKKDHDTLLNTIPVILESKPKTVFLIVGDGVERTRLEKKVIGLSVSENVIFTGYSHNISGILANTHISVLMTNIHRHLEGIPNCILESLAMGVPVIASKGGGADEVIESGTNGILLDPYDKKGLAEWVLRILDDHRLQRRFRESGKRIVESKFGYERFIREHVTLYDDLLNV